LLYQLSYAPESTAKVAVPKYLRPNIARQPQIPSESDCAQGCAQTGSGLSSRLLAGLPARYSLSEIAWRDDSIPPIHGLRLVAYQLHCYRAWHAGSLQVSNGSAPEIMRKQAYQSRHGIRIAERLAPPRSATHRSNRASMSRAAPVVNGANGPKQYRSVPTGNYHGGRSRYGAHDKAQNEKQEYDCRDGGICPVALLQK
jgi:hypothetical protein